MTSQPLYDRACHPRVPEIPHTRETEGSEPAPMRGRWRAKLGSLIEGWLGSPKPTHAPDGLVERDWDREIRRELIRITARRFY